MIPIINLLSAIVLPAVSMAATINPADFQLRPDKTLSGLASSDVLTRRSAIHQFVSSLDTKFVKEYDNSLLPVLLASARDSDPEVRYYGLSAARMLAHAVILSKGSKDHRIFGRAVSIDFAKEPELLPLFQKAAKDRDSKIRICGVAALAKGYPPSADLEKFLITLAQTETDSGVRREIVDGLGAGQYRSSGAVQALTKLLEDQSEDVRGWAGFFLGQTKSKDSLPALVSKLNDARPFVRERISSAIGNFGSDARKYAADLRKTLDQSKDDASRRALETAIKNVEATKEN